MSEKWRNARNLFLRDWIPFFGPMKNCSTENVKEALAESLWTTAASTMPLWFMPLILPFLFANDNVSEELKKAFATGELFIYASALLGPLIYTLNKDYGVSAGGRIRGIKIRTIKFPHSGYFIGSSFLILLISSAAFYIIRDPAVDVTGKLNNDGIFRLSSFIYIVSILIYFCAASFRNMLDGFKSDEEDEEFAKSGRASHDDRPFCKHKRSFASGDYIFLY